MREVVILVLRVFHLTVAWMRNSVNERTVAWHPYHPSLSDCLKSEGWGKGSYEVLRA